MQQFVILSVINCSSTCFGRLYAYHQEVRLLFTAYSFLFCCSCCDVGESDGKLCALCGVKKKVKAVCGSYSTAALSSFIHLQWRCPHQAA